MNFGEEQLKAQEALVSELEKELERLDNDFARLLKEANLTPEELAAPDPAALTPELRDAYQAAVDKAQREGQARAGRFETARSTASVPGTGRRDVIRL